MSADSAPLVDLAVRPSRRLAALIFLSHALALGAAAYAQLSPLLLAAAGATVVTSFVVLFRRHAMRLGAQAVRRIIWTGDDRWELVDGADTTRRCTLLPEHTPGPPLTILRLRDEGGTTRVLLLLDDSADADQLRKLRARLRLG